MFGRSSQPSPPTAVKIVISGGFGVGKTTLVSAISEIEPLVTEAAMTEVSVGIDDTSAVSGKTTTTVALDFGRITLDESLVLYLFGTPGQARFWTMWDDLCRGAVGAVVLVDTRRLDASFPAINYLELDARIPFVVAVNLFEGVLSHPLEDVRAALGLDVGVPVITVDARDRGSVAQALARVVAHAISRGPSALQPAGS